MIWLLRFLFILIIGSMLGVTTWASRHQALGDFARSTTFHDPWVIATLFDAYWAFITFFVWVAWKENHWLARFLWFVAIVLLGNIAMATYMLAELFAIPATSGRLREVFTHQNPGKLALPATLAALAVGIYSLA